MKSKKIKEILLQNTKTLFSDYPVMFAYLYGSYSTGYEGPFSDLDIAVYADESRSFNHLTMALDIALDVDIIFGGNPQSDIRLLNDLPLAVAGRVLMDGQLIYSINEETRVNYETSVRHAYFDFIPVIREYHKICMLDIIQH
jgi:uncharacterized protein